MDNVLIASTVLLWIAVVVLGFLVLALTRQIGVLYERVAPAGALALNSRLRVGDEAPVIAGTALSGDTVDFEVSGDGSRLLFFLAPDCPICKSLLPVAERLPAEVAGLTIVYVSDGDDLATHSDFAREHGLDPARYVVSEVIGRSYGVGKLPYAVLVGSDGRVQSMGIVNSREHLESLFEAQRLGVASLQDYLGRKDPELTYDATAEEGR